MMMASRIYRKLSSSSSNFMSQSLSFHHQRSLTSSNFTSHKKLASFNPQNLMKPPYSHNPTRHNINHSDYSSSQLLFVSNLTPKSLTHSHFQNPNGIKSRFVSSTSNPPPNESSETPSENYEFKVKGFSPLLGVLCLGLSFLFVWMMIMASRIYRKLSSSSSSNFLNQSLLTSSNLTSHNKLGSLNPLILIKRYSQNPTSTRHNINQSDDSSSLLFFELTVNPKSRNFQNPCANESSHELEIKGPTVDRDVSDLVTMMKSVYHISMASAGIAVFNLGLRFWISYTVQNWPIKGLSVLGLGLVAIGIPLLLRFLTESNLKLIYFLKKEEEQGMLQITSCVFSKTHFERLVWASKLFCAAEIVLCCWYFIVILT